MTHHIQNIKTVAEDNVKKIRSNRNTFEKTTCSFCDRPANQFDFLDERNFVPIKGKTINGQQAVAIYGSCCLNDARRVNDIKRAFIITKRGDDLVPSHVELYTLKNDEEPEEQLPDQGSKKRVEGDQVTLKDKVEDELSTGTSAGKEIKLGSVLDGEAVKKVLFGGSEELTKEEEKKKTSTGIFKVFKKDE
jgi:hypothetical protein